MKTMQHLNPQDNKLRIIEQLIILNDDSVFEKIETILNESMHRPKISTFTKQDLITRAKQSDLDIENKDVYTQTKVEKLSQSW